MASLGKLMDWVGPLIFIGGAAYLYWAWTNRGWPFNQRPGPMTMADMQAAMDMSVPIEELSRIPIDTTGVMTAIPGDQITPLISTGLSPLLVPTTKDRMGITAPMPTPPPRDGMGAGVPIGTPGGGGKPVVIGGTGASNQKSSPIPPIFSSPIHTMPVSIMTPSGMKQIMPAAAVPASMMPSDNVQRNVMMNVSTTGGMQTITQRNVIGPSGGMVIAPRLPTIIQPKLPTLPAGFMYPTFPTVKIPTFPTIH